MSYATDSDPINLESSAATVTALPPSLRIQRIADTVEDYLITIDQPDTDTSLPVLFIDVLDISGSMGCPASDNATREAAAFSRADLVRHSVATQIELLRPQDSLAVVLFDHNSQLALAPTQDRGTARGVLPHIQANGGTNIWAGLFRALQVAEEQTKTATTPIQNVTILLQTDGQSDPSYNPPRGIVPTLRAWLDAHPTVRLTIHTIGYGMSFELDTPLLTAIANATGGTYNYIPDGSMVGTVFIHLMANLMSINHKDLVLQIPEAGYFHNIGTLQSGQVKEIVVRLPTPLPTPTTLSLRNITGILATTTVTSDTLAEDPVPAGFPSAVHATLRALRLATHDADPFLPNPLTELQTTLQALLHTDPSHRMMALLTDLSDPADDKGQISKAFASTTAFRRWGRHYIPTVISSLENGWAINFKDTLSTEVFGTPMTRFLVERGDAIFMALPPPTPTDTHHSYASSASTPAASMASLHSSAGPCFLPGSLMRMADGTEKRCDQVRPGDRDVAGYTIQCVIKTMVPYADIVRLEGTRRPDNTAPLPDDAGFTLWHPVLPDGGEWTHPATIGPVERVPTDAIYNFVLAEEYNPEMGAMERPGMLIINGLLTCAMGHPFRANAVIDHPYFGAPRPGYRHILDDLQQQPGWTSGYVTWGNLQVSHDPATGMINGMRPIGVTSGMRPIGVTSGMRPIGVTSGMRPAGVTSGMRPIGVTSGMRPAGVTSGMRPMGVTSGMRPAPAGCGYMEVDES